MVQFLSITFFLGFLQFLLDFSKVPVFLCHSVQSRRFSKFYSGIFIILFVHTCPCREPDEPSLYTPIWSFKGHFNIIVLATHKLSKWSLFYSFPHQILNEHTFALMQLINYTKITYSKLTNNQDTSVYSIIWVIVRREKLF